MLTPVEIHDVLFTGINSKKLYYSFFSGKNRNIPDSLFKAKTPHEIKQSTQAMSISISDIFIDNMQINNILHSTGCVTVSHY
jgi:hypothetical protein